MSYILLLLMPDQAAIETTRQHQCHVKESGFQVQHANYLLNLQCPYDLVATPYAYVAFA